MWGWSSFHPDQANEIERVVKMAIGEVLASQYKGRVAVVNRLLDELSDKVNVYSTILFEKFIAFEPASKAIRTLFSAFFHGHLLFNPQMCSVIEVGLLLSLPYVRDESDQVGLNCRQASLQE